MSYSLDFTLYQVKLFLTVAKLQSFSKASEELFLEQSTLSRRISMLEQELGFRLFDRKSRPIRMTIKGEKLYEQWFPILGAFEHTLSMVQSLKENDKLDLKICIVDSGMHLNDIPAISQMMQEAQPDVSLSFNFPSMSQWHLALEKGFCDLVITVAFDAMGLEPGYVVTNIVTVPKLVCMLKSNPLCGKNSILYEDLADQHFISIDDNENPRHAAFIRQQCRQHGFEPTIDRRSANAHGLTAMLQHNDEVLICDQFLRGYDNPLFKSYCLPDTFSGLCAVYSDNNKNPLLDLFLEIISSYYNR